MHQACVFVNKAQYEKANNILTSVIKEALEKRYIGKGLYEAISQFQVQLNKKNHILPTGQENQSPCLLTQ
jgi:hypothetical protein